MIKMRGLIEHFVAFFATSQTKVYECLRILLNLNKRGQNDSTITLKSRSFA